MRWHHTCIPAACAVLMSCGGGATESKPAPPPPTPEPVAAVSITPDSSDVTVGESSQLTATAKDASGNSLSGRTITWASSNAAVATVSGTGLVTTLTVGRVTLTASAEGKSGTAVLRAFAVADTIPGVASSPAVAAIPLRPAPQMNPAEFTAGSPGLPRGSVSFRDALLLISADATLAQLNALLKLVHAEIVAGSPGVPGQVPGIIVVRLQTTSHAEMAAALTLLRQQPIVRQAQPDLRVAPHTITAPNVLPSPFQWTWERTPSSANWGLEAIRVPSLWNLNDAVLRSGNKTLTAVFDVGFFPSEDLQYEQQLAPSYTSSHGTHVSGIIAAIFNNGTGIDGVNPFTRLVSAGGFETMSAMVTDFRIFLDSLPAAKVVNLSIGYNTGDNGENTATDVQAQQRADADGDFVTAVLQAIAASRALPMIVVSGGNDSDTFPNQQVRYASPYANAAIRGAAPIIVVEAVENNFTTGRQSRAPYSNVGGHVSAPGSAVLSTIGGTDYDLFNGTSQASPFVAGLVSYLYALDPTLPAPTMTSNPVRDLLVRTAKPITGAAPMIDAFAAALEVDKVQGNEKVLRALLDIDDGTVDGNSRTGPNQGTEDADGNGGRGDGNIDMSDFRRWRDWFLQIDANPALKLDGPATHPKRDLNGDGLVETPAKEGVYPRGDFNGDGQIDFASDAPMNGALSGQRLTDLDVLRSRFVDPNYHETALPNLVYSVDLTIDASACFSRPGVAAVLTEIQLTSNPGNTIRARVHRAADGPQEFTEHVDGGGHRIIVSALDQQLNKTGLVEIRDVVVELGGDFLYTPACQPPSVVFGAGISVSEIPSCTDRQAVQTGTSVTVSVPHTCLISGSTFQLLGETKAVLGRGTLTGSVTRTGTPTGFARAVGYGSQFLEDIVTIDAPGLAGTTGSFTAAMQISGTITATGPCGGNDAASASYSLNGSVFQLSGGIGQILFGGSNYARSPCSIGGTPPPTTRTGIITFTYGVPFRMSYSIQALVVTDVSSSSATSVGNASIDFRWMGMTGLPPGVTLTSALGVKWIAAIP